MQKIAGGSVALPPNGVAGCTWFVLQWHNNKRIKMSFKKLFVSWNLFRHESIFAQCCSLRFDIMALPIQIYNCFTIDIVLNVRGHAPNNLQGLHRTWKPHSGPEPISLDDLTILPNGLLIFCIANSDGHLATFDKTIPVHIQTFPQTL